MVSSKPQFPFYVDQNYAVTFNCANATIYWYGTTIFQVCNVYHVYPPSTGKYTKIDLWCS